MLGVLVTFLFAAGAACFGHALIRALTGGGSGSGLDPALRLGLAGLIGLGSLGTLTLFIGLAPGGLSAGGSWILVLLVAAAGALAVRRKSYRIPVSRPAGIDLAFLVVIGLAMLFALVSVLAPSDTVEWDSLAYHLAVPKLWLEAGQIQAVSFIHHSNFPFAVDNLYIWGLLWGGQSGAKAFTLAFHLFGLFAIFGFTRGRYGRLAAWWACLAWSTIPVVLWLSGTAYVDVQHGLYAGLGILFAAEFAAPAAEGRQRSDALLAAILLGLAAGSKYTGLQTMLAVGVVLFASITARRLVHHREAASASPKLIVAAAALALAIASPWYIKNALWMGNPVYPFFYSRLGGRYWSDWQSKIYQDEQQSFGAGRPFAEPYTGGPLSAQRVGHAILGLAYQPGRYVNPGQTQGLGFPIGAVGVAIVGSFLTWLISGRMRRFEWLVVGPVLVSLVMWFALSQQSRYIVSLGVPLAVLLGGGVVRLRAGPILGAVAVIQALVSLYIVKSQRFDNQIQVVAGKISAEDYQSAIIPFAEPARHLNEVAKGGRVALFDEVFGYLLDVPYLWANPGHSNELGYERMERAEDLVEALRREGITHVYAQLVPPGSSAQDPQLRQWIAAFGLDGAPVPYPAEQRAHLMEDLNWRAKILLAEAVAEGRLRPERAFGSRIIFQVEPSR